MCRPILVFYVPIIIGALQVFLGMMMIKNENICLLHLLSLEGRVSQMNQFFTLFRITVRSKIVHRFTSCHSLCLYIGSRCNGFYFQHSYLDATESQTDRLALGLPPELNWEYCSAAAGLQNIAAQSAVQRVAVSCSCRTKPVSEYKM